MKNHKGSFTIEATIVMTVTMFIICLLVYMGIFLYQIAKLQTVAINAAQLGAERYTHEKKDIYMSRIAIDSFEKVDPYWRIFDWGSESNEKVSDIKKFLDLNVTAFDTGALGPHVHPFEVESRNFLFLYRDVTVNLDVDYKSPVPGVFTMFGLKIPFPMNGYAIATINEPAEFIRNVDLGMDLVKRTGIMEKINEKIGPILEKLKT